MSVTDPGAADRPAGAAGADVEASPDVSTLTRIDAHVHSKASDGPVNKAVGLIGCPECYSEPERIFDQAMARGMDLVTITDHDTVRGAMELVERGFQRFIVGEEVSVVFPEDRCLLHVLVWGLTAEQDEQITSLGLRDDVYTFASWLREQRGPDGEAGLPHALAHPLYVQNGRLTRWHVERAALLFKGFECLNGAHAWQQSDAITRFLDRLTPGRYAALAEAHGIAPVWDRGWEKGRTAGSDDHALLNIGRSWTGLSNAVATGSAGTKLADPAAFFRHAMRCDTEIGGVGGHESLLAHQLATVGAHYYADRLYEQQSPTGRLVASKLLRFAGVTVRAPSRLRVAAHQFTRRLWVPRRRKKKASARPLLRALRREIGPLLERYPDIRERLDPATWADGAALSRHERMAEFSRELVESMSRAMSPGLVRSLRHRDAPDILEHVVSYGLLHAALLPYLFSLFHQNKERNFLEQFEHETADPGSGVSVLERPMRISLFTDTIADVNGVCRFIQNVAERSLATGNDLQVITSTRLDPPPLANIHNFRPVFASAMPRYENLDIVLPPILQILRHVDTHRPDVIHISTPGPVGLIGFLAAKQQRVPVLGVYHTDFPAYVERLFDDDALTGLCRRFMRWFYHPFTHIFTRSEDYVRSLTELGLKRESIIPLMPGFDNEVFSRTHRDPAVWRRLEEEVRTPIGPAAAEGGPVKVLYVGRVSVEKNLPLLVRIWNRVVERLAATPDGEAAAQLIVVGDGPYREKMVRELSARANRTVRFLGFRHGQELSTIYASSDLFVFPSVTDTLGQVVMESQGSALPVLVSDIGGPKEVVLDDRTGYVLPHDDPEAWVDRLVGLITDHDKRRRMGDAAFEHVQQYSLVNSFEHFWQVHVAAWHESLARRGIRPATPEPVA